MSDCEVSEVIILLKVVFIVELSEGGKVAVNMRLRERSEAVGLADGKTCVTNNLICI